MAEFVSTEVRDGVATIHLNRPPMNALNLQMQQEIRAAAEELGARSDVRVIVLYGGPKVFAAGADVKEMAEMSYADMESASSRLQEAFTAVALVPQPTIAAITGYALGGGCELALCCDLRIVAEDAKLGQPEVLLGIMPGAGGSQRLPRLIGPSRAKDLIYTGRHVDAAEALAIGLANAVVPADDTYAAAMRLAARLADGAPLALRASKAAIDHGLDVELAVGLEFERQQFAALFGTQDKSLGMHAFVEKRRAEFTGT